ncbi:Rid family detoxifying hydrolase [Buchnera aphidicola (Kurisakia onigurumii)]|uniref:Rid family detoxifying hydrolase n=1 Tax=Buchnera aphidicola TaxID=9 RepID=UPI0031B72FCA
MSKTIIKTKKSPIPIGPYSQGVQKNNFIFISGQIPIQNESNYIPDDIKDQTKLVLLYIENILNKAKLKVHNIVKTTIFVSNLNDFKNINKIYKNFFDKKKCTYPARSCVEVSRLPKEVKIEIEAIAIK